jgi:hypothetical protein
VEVAMEIMESPQVVRIHLLPLWRVSKEAGAWLSAIRAIVLSPEWIL